MSEQIFGNPLSKNYYEMTENGYVLRTRSNTFIAAIHSRECKQKNNVIDVFGARGNGKSAWAIKISEILSKKQHNREFTADDIVFTYTEFMTRVSWFQENKVPYAWLMFDEAGLSFRSRDFMSDLNKALTSVLQSFRFTKVNLLVTVPHPSLIDINLRNMADFWVDMHGWGRGKIYRINWSIFHSNVQTPTLCTFENVTMPSEKLWDAYLEKKNVFLKHEYEKWLMKSEQSDKQSDVKVVLKNKKDEIIEKFAVMLYEGKISKRNIANEAKAMGYSQSIAYDVSYQAEKLWNVMKEEKAKEDGVVTEVAPVKKDEPQVESEGDRLEKLRKKMLEKFQ